MAERSSNPNSASSTILKCIKDFGPVTAIEIAHELKISTQRVQSAVGFMRKNKSINIQKKGNLRRKESLKYFYDPEFPTIGAPSLTEQKEKKEEDDLFDELNKDEEQIAPMKEPALYPAHTPGKTPKGLDKLVNRCHHLVLALEHCSSNTIMDSFNLSEEQARILMNKVVSKYGGMNVSFCINVAKEK